MQIKIDSNKNVHLSSESAQEAQELFGVFYKTEAPLKTNKGKVYRTAKTDGRKRRSNETCPICGKVVKGLKMHMRLVHSESAARTGGLLN